MKLLDRYIINNFFWNLLGVLFICVVVFLVYMLIGSYEDILSNAPSMYFVIVFFANSLPFMMVEVIPLGIAIAALLTVGNMARSREILALLTTGVSQKRIVTPLFYVSILLAIGLFFFSETVVPRCEQRARYIEKAFIEGKGEQIVARTENIFVKGEGNRFYLMENYDSLEKSMNQPVIYDTNPDGSHLTFKMTAKEADFVAHSEKGSVWRFRDMAKWEFDEEGRVIDYERHKEPVEITLEVNLDKFLSYKKEPEEMNLWELYRYLSILKHRGENIGRYATDLYIKISFPAAVIIIMLICFSYASKMQLGNLVMNFAQAMLLVVAFYAFLAFTQAMGHNLIIPPLIAAWAPDIVFAFIGFTVFKYNTI